MECPLWRLLISSRSVNKHGHHRQFLFLIGRYLKNLLLNTQPSIHVDAFYQVSVHLDRQFQRRRFFRYRPIRNKNCLWWPCLLTDRDEMSNLHRGHSIVASCHISVNIFILNSVFFSEWNLFISNINSIQKRSHAFDISVTGNNSTKVALMIYKNVVLLIYHAYDISRFWYSPVQG
jgi:hypothetical protein